ncbi:MAG: von Willebrand factor type A domain-containing protein [Planctomycetota bacterium]
MSNTAAPSTVMADRANRGFVANPGQMPQPVQPGQPADPQHGREQFKDYGENPWTVTKEDALSTFAIDVDTASYTLMRNDILQNGRLPERASVRAEEYLNYFNYGYAGPAPGGHPFAVHVECAESPFSPAKKLLRVGVQGYEVPDSERKPANLIFLIDVSGSMNDINKLPLVKYALRQLVDRLDQRDTLGIVVYSGRQAVLLPPTPVNDREAIVRILDGMQAGGGTAGAAGIRTAYELAQQRFQRDGINRVILCTDGDFNIGLTGNALVTEVAAQREKGIGLSTFLFGRGNINDAMVEQLANKGNGNHAYIDTRGEALRAMGEKVTGMLQVIAKDVKIQVEFSDLVAKYRLVGYENRGIADQDFRNDKVDAGELGAGHSVTALYELEMAEGWRGRGTAEAVATVRLRYKGPNAGERAEATELQQQLVAAEVSDVFADASPSFRFASSVAWFAQIMKRSHNVDRATLDRLIAIADATKGADADRAEFVRIAVKASDMAELYEPIAQR